jgi:hypothetical protein
MRNTETILSPNKDNERMIFNESDHSCRGIISMQGDHSWQENKESGQKYCDLCPLGFYNLFK